MPSLREQIEQWADTRRGFHLMARRGMIHPLVARYYMNMCNMEMSRLRQQNTPTVSGSNRTVRHSPTRSTATSRRR